MRNTTIRVQAAGEVWAVLGADIAPGVVPEDVVLTANQAGPDQASFTLKRDNRIPWGDLRPFTPVDIEVEGVGLAWSGRIHQATPTDGGWQIQCRGWQHHLDDDVLRRLWVHDRLGDWQDARGWAGTNLTEYGDHLGAQNNGVMSWSLGGHVLLPVFSGGGRSAFYLDGGETGAIKRVVVTWESANNTSSIETRLTFSDTNPGDPTSNTLITVWNGGASGTFAYTLGTARRYVAILSQNATGADYTPLGSTWFRVTRAVAFRATAYESGNASVLRASTVVSDVLSSGAVPLLSTSTGRISTSGLIDAGTRGIPHLTTEGGYETPRQVMQRANAYHDWLLGVDAQRRVFFQARPTTPIAVLGGWSGDQYQDAGDTGDELYNKVIVQATGLDGQPVQVTRTATSPLLSLAGATRTKILSAEAALTVAAAEVIGDAWLARRATRPARGSLTATGPGSLRLLDGTDVTPAQTLQWPGQLIRIADRWDPDTGGIGRDAAVTDVSWSQATDQASITLDSPNERLDVVLARYASIEASRPAGY